MSTGKQSPGPALAPEAASQREDEGDPVTGDSSALSAPEESSSSAAVAVPQDEEDEEQEEEQQQAKRNPPSSSHLPQQQQQMLLHLPSPQHTLQVAMKDLSARRKRSFAQSQSHPQQHSAQESAGAGMNMNMIHPMHPMMMMNHPIHYAQQAGMMTHHPYAQQQQQQQQYMNMMMQAQAQFRYQQQQQQQMMMMQAQAQQQQQIQMRRAAAVAATSTTNSETTGSGELPSEPAAASARATVASDETKSRPHPDESDEQPQKDLQQQKEKLPPPPVIEQTQLTKEQQLELLQAKRRELEQQQRELVRQQQLLSARRQAAEAAQRGGPSSSTTTATLQPQPQAPGMNHMNQHHHHHHYFDPYHHPTMYQHPQGTIVSMMNPPPTNHMNIMNTMSLPQQQHTHADSASAHGEHPPDRVDQDDDEHQPLHMNHLPVAPLPVLSSSTKRSDREDFKNKAPPRRHSTSSYASASSAQDDSEPPKTYFSTGPFYMLPQPRTLAILESDRYSLTPLHCFVRQHCVEAFTATHQDVAQPSKGKRRPVQVGQVGLRCRHCCTQSSRNTTAAAPEGGSVYYPTTIASFYNATMNLLQRHLQKCPSMPQSVLKQYRAIKQEDHYARSGSSKKYWIQSARQLGFVDTEHGVRYVGGDDAAAGTTAAANLVPTMVTPVEGGEQLHPPLPPHSIDNSDHSASHGGGRDSATSLSLAHPFIAAEYLSPAVEHTRGAQMLPANAETMENSNQPIMEVVEPSDKPYSTDFVYVLMQQMRICKFTEADRLGKRKGLPIGYSGLACRHCYGGYSSGRFFPSSLKTLSDTSKGVNVLHNHMTKCRNCPLQVRDLLDQLRPTHDQQRSMMKFGNQKRFFARIWERLHGKGAPRKIGGARSVGGGGGIDMSMSSSKSISTATVSNDSHCNPAADMDGGSSFGPPPPHPYMSHSMMMAMANMNHHPMMMMQQEEEVLPLPQQQRQEQQQPSSRPQGLHDPQHDQAPADNTNKRQKMK